MISFSIFIASITQTSAPSSTSAPSATATFRIVPWSGETSASLDEALEPPDFRSRFGGRFAAAGAPPPAAAPMTLTVCSRPSTSTLYSRSWCGPSASLSPGFGVSSGANDLSHFLSSVRSRQVSPFAHCSVARIAWWNGIRVLSRAISNSPSARSIRAVACSRSTSQTISLATIGS